MPSPDCTTCKLLNKHRPCAGSFLSEERFQKPKEGSLEWNQRGRSGRSQVRNLRKGHTQIRTKRREVTQASPLALENGAEDSEFKARE